MGAASDHSWPVPWLALPKLLRSFFMLWGLTISEHPAFGDCSTTARSSGLCHIILSATWAESMRYLQRLDIRHQEFATTTDLLRLNGSFPGLTNATIDDVVCRLGTHATIMSMARTRLTKLMISNMTFIQSFALCWQAPHTPHVPRLDCYPGLQYRDVCAFGEMLECIPRFADLN